MALTWRDAVATLLIAGAGAITYAKIKGYDWPLLGSWRAGVISLLILGLGTCIIVGSGAKPDKSAWTTMATVLGVLAFGLVIAGIAMGSKPVFLALSGDLIVLWGLSTLHHIVATRV